MAPRMHAAVRAKEKIIAHVLAGSSDTPPTSWTRKVYHPADAPNANAISTNIPTRHMTSSTLFGKQRTPRSNRTISGTTGRNNWPKNRKTSKVRELKTRGRQFFESEASVFGFFFFLCSFFPFFVLNPCRCALSLLLFCSWP